MNQMDKLMQMAVEAGFPFNKYGLLQTDEEVEADLMFERFAELVRKDYSFTHAQMWLKRFDDAIKAENEACAKLCDRLDLEGVSLGGEPAPAYGNDCAKAIRERMQGIQSEHCTCPGFCTGMCEAGL